MRCAGARYKPDPFRPIHFMPGHLSKSTPSPQRRAGILRPPGRIGWKKAPCVPCRPGRSRGLAANNDIGTLQTLADIGRVCKARKVLSTPMRRRRPARSLDVEARRLELELICSALSRHKMYGPKGSGLCTCAGAIRMLTSRYSTEAATNEACGAAPARATYRRPWRRLPVSARDLESESERLLALRNRLMMA